ncbi:MAG: sigma-54-dependent Fis family transcriptional regulator [Bacteroidia bacterium]|nr:sigma-54 dependent transcriptional regulator [Bacteroidia bacterium]NNM16302.1 sigma-54-dependent Fis family transcriptional regulator [Bacteroidia bacterium]
METKHSAKIFIVDDDVMVASLIKKSAEDLPDVDCYVFGSAEECLSQLHLRPDVITIDYYLPDSDGLELLKKVKAFDESINTIIISGQQNIDVVVESYRNGAQDYIVKDENMVANLHSSFKNLLLNVNLRKEVEILQEQIIDRHKYNHIIGNSPQILNVLKLIQKVERSNISVLVTGESGTGKELVSRAIHYNSKRKKKPFVAVNLSAIPNDLLESELFGHEKGAFTDARSRRIGKFEQADSGSIFLDEICEMETGLQSKLLRVLQEKELSRIGSNKLLKLDFRMISATNQNIKQHIKEGKFREDLFYRIQGFQIELPPLRERGDDIILLSNHFLDLFTKQNNLDNLSLSKKAKEYLMQYSWPGNVRELKSVIERAALLCENEIIDVSDIQILAA